MLSIALALLLSAAPFAQDDKPKAPDTEQVKAMCAKLEAAFEKGKTPERLSALKEAQKVVDKAVIAWVEKGLRDREAAVKGAALESLRWMRHPEALKVLHASYKNDREMRKNDELVGLLLRAIGQHADPKSIELLREDPFETPNHASIKARILGLGMIRTKESVEALIELLRMSGPKKSGGYMVEFRLALFYATGHDEGPNQDLWIRWWNENRKTLEITERPTELPRLERMRWNDYWGLTPEEKKGEDGSRGKDGKGGEKDGG